MANAKIAGIEITDREKEALVIIYHVGIISRNHLNRLVWNSNIIDKRLCKLCDHNYLKKEKYQVKLSPTHREWAL